MKFVWPEVRFVYFFTPTFRPSLLESFAVVSSQISSIHTLLRNDKTPALRGWSVLPIRLALEFDPELQVSCDGVSMPS